MAVGSVGTLAHGVPVGREKNSNRCIGIVGVEKERIVIECPIWKYDIARMWKWYKYIMAGGASKVQSIGGEPEF